MLIGDFVDAALYWKEVIGVEETDAVEATLVVVDGGEDVVDSSTEIRCCRC